MTANDAPSRGHSILLPSHRLRLFREIAMHAGNHLPAMHRQHGRDLSAPSAVFICRWVRDDASKKSGTTFAKYMTMALSSETATVAARQPAYHHPEKKRLVTFGSLQAAELSRRICQNLAAPSTTLSGASRLLFSSGRHVTHRLMGA